MNFNYQHLANLIIPIAGPEKDLMPYHHYCLAYPRIRGTLSASKAVCPLALRFCLTQIKMRIDTSARTTSPEPTSIPIQAASRSRRLYMWDGEDEDDAGDVPDAPTSVWDKVTEGTGSGLAGPTVGVMTSVVVDLPPSVDVTMVVITAWEKVVEVQGL